MSSESRPSLIALRNIGDAKFDWSKYDVAYSIYTLVSAILSGTSIILYYSFVGNPVFASLFGLSMMSMFGIIGGWFVRVWYALDVLCESVDRYEQL